MGQEEGQAFVTVSGNGRVLAEGPERDGLDNSPWYIQAGKMYLPFATRFEYHTFDVISEPYTLELGETLETSLQIGWIPDNSRRRRTPSAASISTAAPNSVARACR